MLDRRPHRAARMSPRTRRQHNIILDKLGEVPGLSLQAMCDYGLNDREIGRYFEVTTASVGRLRRALGCSR